MGVCVFLVSKMKSSWMHVCVVQETSLNFVQVCCVEKKQACYVHLLFVGRQAWL